MTEILAIIFYLTGNIFIYFFSELIEGFSLGWIIVSTFLLCILIRLFLSRGDD